MILLQGGEVYMKPTLFVTARANFVNDKRSCTLQRTEQYIRSISTAMAELDTYTRFPEEDVDSCGDEFNRMLFFFCNLVGAFGLCKV